ncbi:MAG: hypothetical protein U0869_12895 [Chloroflexota bacterium]
MSLLRHRLLRLLPAIALPALLVATAAGPVAAAAPRPSAAGPADASGLTIQAFIWQCVAFGGGVPDGQTLASVTVRRKDGTKVAVDQIGDSLGSWQMATVCDNKGKGAILPGDRIKLTLSDTTSRTFIVPDLIPYGDPSTGKLGGPAPAGGTLVVKVATCDGSEPGDCGTYVISDHPTYVRGAKAWSWTAFNYPVDTLQRTWLTGLDLLTVQWEPNASEHYEVTQYDANVLVRAGSPLVTGYGRLGKGVTVTLKSAKGAVRATGTTTVKGFRGAWSVTLKQDGRKVAPRVGDVVSASIIGAGTLKLRRLGLTVDPAMPTLHGQCWPARLWSAATSPVAVSNGWTATDGSFALNFGTLPATGTKLALKCAAVPGAIQVGTWTMPAH